VMVMMDIANIRSCRSMGDSAATVWMDDDDGEDDDEYALRYSDGLYTHDGCATSTYILTCDDDDYYLRVHDEDIDGWMDDDDGDVTSMSRVEGVGGEDATGDELALRARDVARERLGGSRTLWERPHGVDDVCYGVYRKCDDGIERSLCVWASRASQWLVSVERCHRRNGNRRRIEEATTRGARTVITNRRTSSDMSMVFRAPAHSDANATPTAAV